ncbi:MAG: type I-U CRISPR-associated helicase/endonuclease Cas3 [Acidimicrobiaceae bacterium]|nr:type I-U CRISPR-associated helicase/endonuclease Cas3 [Acidimicrobiaceae bacterium]MXZ99943.1 type I-U CRISPR-associated helicase/endonuclease Cas3 [Acidimicrobiaceae bacterium]MYE76103.1 type I-U CRISPR-associated helicase/endonuclease Cas3 [Acidimicrobiaceae bacterium]MYE98415.1 type I-U CRISPR-associated helicase/endonuclease Cas3 [Acidimicrobiaceae bacterium]MYI53469.1 type I-U CRISPR-associated helicase/endonuclease Cas3 [Acidimicrobiaceae bacterium]
MSELAAAQFDDFFSAVHGHQPYPWQSRLTREVLEGDGWPDVIDLPTGTGKTAVLDTAVFALALRPDVSPRRIVFVIDRRIVVDQVYERARRIRDRISAADAGVLAEVRSLLGDLTGDEQLLGVAALRGGRGGIPLDAEWARRPDQPWVMVSTVDQFGSRLLFRGYGASPRKRPILAGLAGNDCLVFLDEVHLSRPFAATLRDATSDGQVPLIRSVNPKLLPRRFKVVEMSATPTSKSARRFELQHGDLEQSERLSRIAMAPKRATLVTVGGSRPPHESVPRQVLDLIKNELHEEDKSVGVIVNRVRTARETQQLLCQNDIAARLLTGRMRPIDKARALDDIQTCVDPDRESPLEGLSVVVATQAIEVGADFSFDALITEAAPVDSLCQRLGRLDRRGSVAEQRQAPARCWILGVRSELKAKRSDPVYGDAIRHTWDALQSLGADGEVDVGPGSALIDRLGAGAIAPNAEEPLLLHTYVDAWTQTSPVPVVDPPIAEFLHGKDSQSEPDVSVVWRWDWSKEALDLVPVRPAESLSVPASAVRSWLRDTAEVLISDAGSASHLDAAAKHGQADGELELERLGRVRRWNGDETQPTEAIERVIDIRPGDLLIVDPVLGGLRGSTWDPSASPSFSPSLQSSQAADDGPTEPVEDLGDQAQLAYEARATLRLDSRLLAALRLPSELRAPSPQDELDATLTPREAVDNWLARLSPGTLPEWILGVADRLQDTGFDVETVGLGTHSSYYVLVERAVDPAVLDEFDDRPSLTGRATTLREHLQGVGDKAEDYGRRLGLNERVVADLRLAGQLHDLGKIDSRFQAQMHGHDQVAIAAAEAPLAKSVPGARTRRNRWPPVRHEFGSVALAQSNSAILDRAHDSDLVLHLMGSHHGYGRPLPPIRFDDAPQDLTAEGRVSEDGFRLGPGGADGPDASADGAVRMSVSSNLAETPLALDMADRFWRLQERYGHHGLAWLEALFRLADQQRSAEEAR